VARFYREAAILEGDQWRIIENLRTKAPENERELARQIADQLEEELRKGSGNA
jgi:type II secretory pathway component PulF